MKKIGIIGAGISGLVTAKAFLAKGYEVIVIEKASSIGGVWEKSRSYHGVTTQTTRDEYAYSDFPMPADYPLWPSGSQVQRYLENYASAFGINRFIRFNKQVNSLRYNEGRWYINISDNNGEADTNLVVDFVCVCTGTFHKPVLPQFAGMQSFLDAGGSIIHSSKVQDTKTLMGKSVAVIGFAKSATDIATLAADVSKRCTLIYRKAQWKIPRFFGNKINMRYLLFSRLSEAFFNGPNKTFADKLLHSIGRPVVWAQWRGLEMLLKTQFKLKRCNMVPEHKIEDQINCALGVAPVGFYEKVQSGKIAAKCTEVDRFEGRNMILKNGEVLTPDLVVCGTGFTQELPFLEDRYKNQIIDEKGNYQLFRNILSPDVPQLGFVGFNSSLFSTLTSEVAANWLAEYVSDAMQLPAESIMKAEMNKMEAWRRKSRPASSVFSSTCIAPFNFLHIDELMRDMGLKTRLNRSLKDFVKPINPADYRILLNAKKKGIVNISASAVQPKRTKMQTSPVE